MCSFLVPPITLLTLPLTNLMSLAFLFSNGPHPASLQRLMLMSSRILLMTSTSFTLLARPLATTRMCMILTTLLLPFPSAMTRLIDLLVACSFRRHGSQCYFLAWTLGVLVIFPTPPLSFCSTYFLCLAHNGGCARRGCFSFGEKGSSIGVAVKLYGITFVRLLCHQEDDEQWDVGIHRLTCVVTANHSFIYLLIYAYICSLTFPVMFRIDCAVIRLLCVSSTKLVSR